MSTSLSASPSATPYAGPVPVKQQVGSSAITPFAAPLADPFSLALPSAAGPAWAPLGGALAPLGGFGWGGDMMSPWRGADILAPFGGDVFGGLGLVAADPQMAALQRQVSQQMADVSRRLYSRMPPQMAVDVRGELSREQLLYCRRDTRRAACQARPARTLIPRTPTCSHPPPHAHLSARQLLAESKNEWDMQANLPGVKKENISVEVSRTDAGDNLLTITAHRVARERSEDPTLWHRRERVDSTVKRTLTLPANVDLGGVSSRLENGVLHVTMRKMPASQVSAEPRAVPIA